MKLFAWQSPYATFDNNPVFKMDPLGNVAQGPGPEDPKSKNTASSPDPGKPDDNILLKSIDKAAGQISKGLNVASDWWNKTDFSMTGEVNINAGAAFQVEAEAFGAKLGGGKGTKYKVAGGSLTLQSGETRNGYSDVNGTRSNADGYYIGKDGQFKVEEFKSAGGVVGGKENLTYDKSVKTGNKSNVVRTISANDALIKVEHSQNLKEYPRGGLSGMHDNNSPTSPTGKTNQFVGFKFSIDVLVGVGFDASFKVGFTNNYVKDNTPY